MPALFAFCGPEMNCFGAAFVMCVVVNATMNDAAKWQMDWLRSVQPNAVTIVGEPYWRVALAIAAHESACGTSHLAIQHLNLHGIRAVGDQPRTEDGYRTFDESAQSWTAVRYLLANSSHYREARMAFEELMRRKSRPDEAEKIFIKLIAPVYSEDILWCEKVMRWHEVVCSIWPKP
ncbi:MAG: glucosaminidase domain-containing protein [Anaerolineae bacterium]|nr:glucosaminidase domain-containing protein [Anaerolineae bacterium]